MILLKWVEFSHSSKTHPTNENIFIYKALFEKNIFLRIEQNFKVSKNRIL